MKIVFDTTKSLIPKILFAALFLAILAGIIAYARGYRINLNEGTVTSTGILSVSSSPKPAKVFVNDELKGATDINLTLPYGKYTVEVRKDGYTSWTKEVSLKGEIVMSLDAHLFPKNPSLTPLTNLGIVKAVPVSNTDNMLLVSQTGDDEKDGIYLFESGQRTIAIFPPLKPLVMKTLFSEDIDLSTAEFDFSPNYRQALLTVETELGEDDYLIALDNATTELFEVTGSKENIIAAWNEEKNEEIAKIIETLPKKIVPIATEAFQIISVAPNEKRIMYRAKQKATLPLVIDPPLIGANQTSEERNLQEGGLYIYDKKEDKNYRVPVELTLELPEEETTVEELPIQDDILESSPSGETELPKLWYPEVVAQVSELIQWYPTSDYIAVKEGNKISLMQYDGENKETVYAGPFQSEFFAISPDWNLLVLINLNPQINEYGDLYSVGIK